jgi:predicted nucleotidyltransferase
MDVSNPLRSVAPSVEADVLAVLSGTHLPLTGQRVQELAGRSYGRVRLVLRRLVDHGLVVTERHGNSNTYVLNRDHVLAAPLDAMVKAVSTVETSMREAVDRWRIQPEVVVLFGSFARRDGDADSDIDVLLVRPDGVDADDDGWVDQRTSLVVAVERWSGNRVQIVELSSSELNDAVSTEQPLLESLRSDGVMLGGARQDLRSSIVRVGS